ncbi:ABC transporter substrate-binding protein [Saccharospirillum impatiens]|uniref:ABC transporter substrate-binding protein n=1 Tax=Saccharospirillum impatiens TaxID=169438 RepID=UPI000425BB5E|nr:ABC transporter substrate-binding protein [Saccharospirillum impatiens]
MMNNVKVCLVLSFLCMVTVGHSTMASAMRSIEVLHWWTSSGEQRSATVLKEGLAASGVNWIDYPVRGGGGDSAMAVLKARVIDRSPPGAAQIIGPDIQHWAQLGFLSPLDHAELNNTALFYPVINELIRLQGQTVAIPLSIHRINWMWLNPRVFERLDIPLPTTWSQLESSAPILRDAGIIPLAHGNEPWQNATLFEIVLLSQAGAGFYRKYFVDRDEQALTDPHVVAAFQQLRELKLLMDPGINHREWQQASRLVADGEAAIQIMGDWVKGEFSAWGLVPGEDYLCLPVPGTNEQHLYSIDTFVMFHDQPGSIPMSTFIDTLLSPAIQRDFSRAKGTIPARMDIPVGAFDDCSRASHYVFGQASQQGLLAPSIAHSMAMSPESEDAVFEIVHRFFNEERMTPELAAIQLAQTLRALK